MEHREASEVEDDDVLVDCELEAAEALSALARCSVAEAPPLTVTISSSQEREMDVYPSSCGGYTSETVTVLGTCTQTLCSPSSSAAGYQSNYVSLLSQNSDKDRVIAAQNFSGSTSGTVPGNRENIIQTVSSHLCSVGNQSSSSRRLKKNLNEAEKEAQKLRRVLANRESARQTIRRRQEREMDVYPSSCGGYTSETVTVLGTCTQTLCSPSSSAAGYQSNYVSLLSQNSDKDRVIAAQNFSGSTSGTVPGNRENIIQTVSSHLCSVGNQSSSSRRLKKNLNEAEKEAQKLRRVLANRESARQTIRRRQEREMDVYPSSCGGYTSETVTVLGTCTQTLCSPSSSAAGYQSNYVSLLSQNSDKDRVIAAQNFSGSTSGTVPGNRENIIQTVSSHLCSVGNQSSSSRRLKKNLNEAEKEAQKLRRVLANRESARQTIRRRQVLYLELSRKAAEVSEENVNLKKEMEIAVKQYNSLKGQNKFLKAQMSKIKNADQREVANEPNSCQTEIPSSAPMFYHNQPSLIPCLWPSIHPSSDVFPFHYASHPDASSSSQFLIPNRQENSTGIVMPAGTPFFVLPVPWLLPFHSHGSTSHTNANRQDEPPPTQQFSTCSSSDSLLHEENIQLSLNLNTRAEGSSSIRTMSSGSVHGRGLFTYPPDTGVHSAVLVPGPITLALAEGLGRTGTFQTNDPPDANAVSAPEHMARNKEKLLTKPEDSLVANEARRRRKQLMKLKNVQCRHDSAQH